MAILAKYILLLVSLSLGTAQTADPDFPQKLQIITEGSPYPNDTTKFHIHHTKDRIDYVFTKGTRCTALRSGDMAIWSRKDRDIRVPTSITYIQDLNQLAVSDEAISVIYNKNSRGYWKFIYTVDNESGEVRDSQELDYLKERLIRTIIVLIMLSFVFLLNPIILALVLYQMKVIKEIRNRVYESPLAPLMA